MTARLSDPVHNLPALRRLIHPTTDLAQAVLDNPQKVVERLFGSLGQYINLEQPVDVAAFNPAQQMPPVISFTLRDFRRARQYVASDFRFTRGHDGGIKVTPKSGADGAGLFEKGHLSCAVYPGSSANEYHLVCSPSSEALEIAGPYLARTASRQPGRPGLHFEFHESFMRAVVAKDEAKFKDKPSSNPGYDQGRELGFRLVEQLYGDIRYISGDVAIDMEGVDGALEFGFRSSRSPMSVGLLGAGKAGTLIPAEFFRIPADADMAFYFPGAAPEIMRAAAEPFWGEIAKLDDEGGQETVKQFVQKLARLFLTGGSYLVAHGSASGGLRIPPNVTEIGTCR